MKKYFCLVLIIIAAGMYSCSKKSHPTGSATNSKTDTSASKAPVIIKRKIKEPVPKVISVNDTAAKKSVDGRYYYDLQGHRYWKNSKDGKYYLFNKSMNGNDDFKGTAN